MNERSHYQLFSLKLLSTEEIGSWKLFTRVTGTQFQERHIAIDFFFLFQLLNALSSTYKVFTNPLYWAGERNLKLQRVNNRSKSYTAKRAIQESHTI